LHPIETVSVRSRIEGDLDAVYVREGEVVTAGKLLARFQSSEQESAQRSAEADRASALADQTNAQWNADQSAQLFKAGAIAERDYKATEQALVSAKARVAATDARLKSTGIALRDTRVVSPTAGIVDKRLVENGEHVSRGMAMFSVVRNNVLELVAALPARDASDVRVDQAVRFVADGTAHSGRVARISPTIDPVTRAVTVYAQIPNPTGTLRGGTFATGQVITRTIPNVLAIPRDALHQSQGTDAPFVYRIEGKAIEVAPVRTGVTDEHLGVIEIVDGLKAGDRIVSGNVGSLGRGMQVTVIGEDTGRGGGGSGSGGRGTGRGRRGAGTPR
jgi:RND family efflux transporter MFP subunit